MGSITDIVRETDEEWDGYRITTTEQEISLFISNQQSCCEDWGIRLGLPAGITRNGIGLQVHSIRWGKDVKDLRTESYGASLEIITNKGVVLLAAWNNHNGYYAHELKASWKGHSDVQVL